MEGEKGIDIGVVQDFPEETPGHEESENIGEPTSIPGPSR